MNDFFQLLDAMTGNVVADFASERELLDALYQVRDEDGEASLAEYVLLRFCDGHPTLVAKEEDLVKYVARGSGRVELPRYHGAKAS